jgi:ribonuclease P protein component
VLSSANRLRSSKDFSQTTKVGFRATSHSLVLYVHSAETLPLGPQVGLIINKSVGGSVTRHRIARQLRHAIKDQLIAFPKQTQIVIRVLREKPGYTTELSELVIKVLSKSAVKA